MNGDRRRRGLFPSREEEAALAPERAARQMVGDGQLPTRYFVTATTDYYVRGSEGDDWASGLRRDVASRMESQTWGPFDTYREARDAFDSLELAEPSPSHAQWTSKFVEDRLSGEIASEIMTEHTKPEYYADTREDLNYTQERMRQAGQRFE